MIWTTEKKMRAGFALALAVASVIGALAYRNTSALITLGNDTRHTRDIIMGLDRTLATLQDAETGQRGYLITGDERYLAPYNRAVADIGTRLGALGRLAAGDAPTAQDVARLRAPVAAKMAELARTVALRRSRGFGAARRVVCTNTGQADMDAIRDVLGGAEARETRKWNEQVRQRGARVQATFWMVGLLIASEFMLLLWAYGLFRRDAQGRVQARAAQEGQSRELEAQHEEVLAQRADLVVAARELEAANARLEYSSRRFEELYQALPTACFCHDTAGRIFEWNRAFEGCYGLKPEQIFQRQIWDVIAAPGAAGAIRAAMTRALGGEPQDDWELTLPGADGESRHLLCNTVPMRGPDGQVTGGISTHLDITERKRVEEALRQAEEKYRGLFENATEGIFQSTHGGRLLDANPAFARMLGYASAAEAIADSTDISRQYYVTPADRERLLSEMGAEGSVSGFEVEMRRVDGSHFWVSMNAQGGRDAQGRLLHYTGTLEDVSKRRQAQEALHKEREFLGALLDNLQEGIVACDADGTLTLFNRATRELHGLPEAPLPPEQWAERFTLYHADGATPLATEDVPLFRAFRGERVSDSEVVIAPINGPARTVVASGQAIVDADGRKIGAVIAMHDVTQRKVMEEALRVSEARLQAFHDITAAPAADLDGKIERLLRLGCREFGMTTGIVAHIDGDLYSVRHVVSPDAALAAGFACDSKDTLCREMVNGSQPMAIEDIGVTDWSRHSGAARFGLQAYFGAPLRAEGEDWGALCFTGTAPRAPFTQAETDFLRLIAQWVGGEVERRHSQQQVLDSEERFRSAIGSMQEGFVVQDAAGTVLMCNEVAERILGLSAGEILNQPAVRPEWRMVRDDGSDFPRPEQPSRRAIATGRPQQDVTMGVEYPDGRVVWLSMNAAPLYRAEEGTPYAAVINFTDITGRRDQELQIASQMAQIRDYTIVLEVQTQELEAQKQEVEAQRQTLEMQKRILERTNLSLEVANSALESLATLDGLTGLKNHRTFQERLEAEVCRSQRYGEPLSLIMLDVDHFKQYNDTYGHPAGDEILRTVGLLLEQSNRETDFAARYGGEEFAVILPNTDGEGARALAERLRAAIAAQEWPERAVTASLGVSTLTPAMTDRAGLVAAADAALYRAKKAGRDRAVHAADPPPPQESPLPQAA